MIGNAASIGVQALQLPFVQGATGGTADQQIQILRKPVPGEAITSPLGGSREFNKANIRIFFADTAALLHPDRPGLADGQDINLVVPAPNTTGIVAGGVATSTAYANSATDTAWNVGGLASPRPLYDGWVRVEYLNTAGNWVGVTSEWLRLGFARGLLPPATPLTGNTINPNAILILQQLADRNGNGTLDGPDAPSTVNSNYSWYPINFYDPREGFPRDHTTLSNGQCTTMGIMNAVELDVGNLRQWLRGTIPGSGQLVDPGNQNGYLVYFSDRRGMNVNPHSHPIANVVDGDPGLENTINSGVGGNGSPGDNVLEPITPGYNNSNGFSPEDVDENGFLDRFGETNISTGFGVNSPTNPYVTVANCATVGRANKVTGARHVLKLVDGALGNLPTLANNTGGFTVVAENPVYVLGDYNASVAEAFWTNANAADVTHSAAAVIADSVTLLSNNWRDVNSMQNTTAVGSRTATDTYYRMAIASGKNMNFPQPNGEPQDFGTDGGVHNFLRYIESWPSLYYRGSLISLYYSEYATGTFKCCTLVYSPPDRHYFFDTQFLVPANLPPGTPLLQDINDLTYWQSFSPCTNQTAGTCTN